MQSKFTMSWSFLEKVGNLGMLFQGNFTISRKIFDFQIKKLVLRTGGESLTTEGKFYQSWREILIHFPEIHAFSPNPGPGIILVQINKPLQTSILFISS